MSTGIIGGGQTVVRGNMAPPRGAKAIGTHFDGRTIYELKVKQYARQVKRDPDGTILYHLNPDGTKRAPMWELAEVDPKIEVFVIDDLGNGMTQKNFNFQPTEADIARARLAEGRTEREAKLEKFVVELENAGLSIEDVIAVVSGFAATTPPPAAPAEPPKGAKAAKPVEANG